MHAILLNGTTFVISNRNFHNGWWMLFKHTKRHTHTHTCFVSTSLIWWMVKLLVLSGCRLWARRARSCVRKCVCSVSSRSRQGKRACTTPGSSWTSSNMPRLNTPSMIRSVRTWWISVWISSETDGKFTLLGLCVKWCRTSTLWNKGLMFIFICRSCLKRSVYNHIHALIPDMVMTYSNRKWRPVSW